jgi:hypothetical protein
MSWSAYLMGTPTRIIEALDKQSNALSGQSKIEYDAVLPSLKTLVEQNFNKGEASTPILRLEASGSGYASDGEQIQRQCTVKIEQLHGLLV